MRCGPDGRRESRERTPAGYGLRRPGRSDATHGRRARHVRPLEPTTSPPRGRPLRRPPRAHRLPGAATGDGAARESTEDAMADLLAPRPGRRRGEAVLRRLRGLPARWAAAGCTCACAGPAATSAAATRRPTSTPAPTTPRPATRCVVVRAGRGLVCGASTTRSAFMVADLPDVLTPVTEPRLTEAASSRPSRSSSPSTTTRRCPAPSPATCAASTARATGSCARRPGDEALEALRELKLRGEPGRRAARRLPDAAR